MEASVQSQVYVFLSTLTGGIFIGLIYDFYRLFRYYSRPKRIKTFIEDLIFWLLLSLMIVLFVNRVNEGEFRAFLFLGFTLGIILYSRLLSKNVIKFISNIIDGLIFKTKKVLKLMVGPIGGLKKHFNIFKVFYHNLVKGMKTLLEKK